MLSILSLAIEVLLELCDLCCCRQPGNRLDQSAYFVQQSALLLLHVITDVTD